MPVVIFPCCGDFQCRQKKKNLVRYNHHHHHNSDPLPDHGWSWISSNGSQGVNSNIGKIKSHQNAAGPVGQNRGWSPTRTSHLYSSDLLSRYTTKPWFNARQRRFALKIISVLLYLYIAPNEGHIWALNSLYKDVIERGNRLPVHNPNYLSYVNTYILQ